MTVIKNDATSSRKGRSHYDSHDSSRKIKPQSRTITVDGHIECFIFSSRNGEKVIINKTVGSCESTVGHICSNLEEFTYRLCNKCSKELSVTSLQCFDCLSTPSFSVASILKFFPIIVEMKDEENDTLIYVHVADPEILFSRFLDLLSSSKGEIAAHTSSLSSTINMLMDSSKTRKFIIEKQCSLVDESEVDREFFIFKGFCDT